MRIASGENVSYLRPSDSVSSPENIESRTQKPSVFKRFLGKNVK